MARYRKKKLQEMTPYTEELWAKNEGIISVSSADRANGSPKEGDMIAINPSDPSDMWLVAKKFFEDNYELAE